MKELTLEILSLYLPYELQVLNVQLDKTFTMKSVFNSNNELMLSPNSFSYYSTKNWKIKPLLLPLEMFKKHKTIGIKLDAFNDIKMVAVGLLSINELPLSTVQEACKKHIDIFNLIPAGHAVSKLDFELTNNNK